MQCVRRRPFDTQNRSFPPYKLGATLCNPAFRTLSPLHCSGAQIHAPYSPSLLAQNVSVS